MTEGLTTQGVFQQIHCHRKLLASRFKDGYERDFEVRNRGVEFLGNRWLTQIRDDEARKTGKSFDRFGVVAVMWPVKVEDDWQVLCLLEFGCDSL